MLIKLSEVEARDLLRSAGVGRLGCILNDEPYITPVNYEFDGNSIFIHSLAGTKVTALRLNPRACLQVDEVESAVSWRSAIAFGKFQEITDSEQRAEIMRRLLKKFPLLTPIESAIAEDGHTPEIVVFQIKVERITGVGENWTGNAASVAL